MVLVHVSIGSYVFCDLYLMILSSQLLKLLSVGTLRPGFKLPFKERIFKFSQSISGTTKSRAALVFNFFQVV